MTTSTDTTTQSISNLFRNFEDKVNSAASQIPDMLNGLRNELFGTTAPKRSIRHTKATATQKQTTSIPINRSSNAPVQSPTGKHKDTRTTANTDVAKNLRATNRILGFNLKKFRTTSKVAMRQLAEDTGISQSTLWRYETGLAVPSQNFANLIQSALYATNQQSTKILPVTQPEPQFDQF